MTQISGTNARFLQTPVILSEVMRVMEPELQFIDVIPFVDSGGQPIVYGKKASKSSDGKKQTPRMTTPSAKFAEVQITRMTKATALTRTEGLAIRIDSDARRLPAGKDMIMDGYETVGTWLAEYLNSTIYSTLDAGSTDAGMTPTAPWSGATATPMLDMENFAEGMVREGYPYRMTDAYVHNNNFKEMRAYLIGAEIPEYRDAVLGRRSTDGIELPIGVTLHRTLNTVADGDIMGLDRNHKGAAAVYYHNDPEYSTPAQITYETVVNGQVVTKTVPNFGLSTYQFFEDDTHDVVIQLWVDNVAVVKDAYGIITDDGL